MPRVIGSKMPKRKSSKPDMRSRSGKKAETVFRIIGRIIPSVENNAVYVAAVEIIGRIMPKLARCLGMRLKKAGAKNLG